MNLLMLAAAKKRQKPNLQDLKGLLLGKKLLAGSIDHGYYGEFSPAEVITGTALAQSIGLTAGVAVNDTSGWLGFSLDDKRLLVAKKPFRHTVNWSQINAANSVTGNRIIVIGGKRYRIRLLKGVAAAATQMSATFDGPLTHDSEWNRLLYHVSGKPFNNANNTFASEGISQGDWAQFTETALSMKPTISGSACWCQESGGIDRKVYRGYNGVSYMGTAPITSTYADYGWRPVLELVE